MANYSVKVIINGIDKATAPIRKVVRALEALGQTESFRRISTALSGVGQSFQRVTQEAGLFANRMGGLTAAGAGLFAAFIKPASEMENLRFRLNDLYKSTEIGGKMFDFLTGYATKSSYSFTMLADSMAVLKGQGLDSLEYYQDIMNYIGAKVPDQMRASNAVLALSQAWGLTKLQMGDARQLIQAGLPVWELLQKATGKTTAQLQKMSSKGQLGRDVMIKLFKLMGLESAKAGDAISQLFSTKLSNLDDAWTVFSYRVMNTKLSDITVFSSIKDDMAKLQDFMTNGFKGETGKKMAKFLLDLYTVGKEVFSYLVPAVQGMARFLTGFSKAVGGTGNAVKVLIGILAAPLVGSILMFIASVGNAILALISFAQSAELAWALLGAGLAILEFITAPITLVVAGIAALAAGALLVAQNWQAISGWFAQMWREWGGLIRLVAPPIAMIVDLAELIAQNWRPLTKLFQAICGTLQEAFNLLGIAIKAVWDGILEKVMAVGRAIKTVAGWLPNVNAFTGQTSFAEKNGANKAALSRNTASAFMPGGRPLMTSPSPYVARTPQRDKLDISLKIDSEARPSITKINTGGNRNIALNPDLGVIYS